MTDGQYVADGFATAPCEHPLGQSAAVELAIALMGAAASSPRLELELLVQTPEDPTQYADLARRWLTSTVEALGRAAVEALEAGPPLPSRSLSRHQGGFGEPGSLWGQVIFNPADRRRQGSLYAWSTSSYERLLARLDEFPLGARIEFSSLDAYGTPGAGEAFVFSVHRDYPDYEGLIRMRAHRVLAPDSPDHVRLDAEWSAFAEAFAETCEVVERPIA